MRSVSNPFRAGGEALITCGQSSEKEERVSNPFRAGGEALKRRLRRLMPLRYVSNPFRAGGEALRRSAPGPSRTATFQTPSERAVRR